MSAQHPLLQRIRQNRRERKKLRIYRLEVWLHLNWHLEHFDAITDPFGFREANWKQLNHFLDMHNIWHTWPDVEHDEEDFSLGQPAPNNTLPYRGMTRSTGPK